MIKTIEEICNMFYEMKEEYVPYHKVVVVGGGFWGELACEELDKMGKEIMFVFDNNKEKHTEHFFFSESTDKWIACTSCANLGG